MRFQRKLNHVLYHKLPSLVPRPHRSSNSSATLVRFLSLFTGDLVALRRLHALIFTFGHSKNSFFAARLAALYSSFYFPDLSSLVLHSVPLHFRDTFLYNSVIKAYFDNNSHYHSLIHYREMLAEGASPDGFTLPIIVSASAELNMITFGMCVHALALKVGLLYVSVGSSLVYMYCKCSVLPEAHKVFSEMPVRDVVCWTSLIVGCERNREYALGLFWLREMIRDSEGEGPRPNSRTLEGGLQACLGLQGLLEGQCLHGFALKVGFGNTDLVKSLLLSFYSKCDCFENVASAFDELLEKDVVSWTEVIGVYARRGLVFDCMDLYRRMLDSGVAPDDVCFSCMLTGFANSTSLLLGEAFHGVILKRSFETSTLVIDSLSSMYSKFQLNNLAEKVADKLVAKDAESWNMKVSQYGKIGMDLKCLFTFRDMQFLGLGSRSDLKTLVYVLYSCSHLEALHLGKSLHCYLLKSESFDDLSVSDILLTMYAKCGSLDSARRIFDFVDKDIDTCNALIAAYSCVGYSYEALCVFDQMLLEDVKPNSTTLSCVLSACSNMAALNKGKWVHSYISNMNFEYDASLTTALIDMYAKCGELETSREIFDYMPEKDEVAWNVMISGYGIHGRAYEALELFNKMERGGLKPNELTFLAALSACNYAGLLEEGRNIFSRMQDSFINPTLKHYACMIDLIARSGNLHEAEAMVLSMPMKPDGGIWGSLLSACRIHNNVEMGERIAEKALHLDPENDGYYVLMSNLYGCFGRWEGVDILRGTMKRKGVQKKAGWSAVELNQSIDVFVVDDKSHPQHDKITSLLKALTRQMEELHDIELDEVR